MNELELLMAELEDANARRRRAVEILRLERLEAACKRHRRRLPAQVQGILDAPVRIAEEPPPIGDAGLFTPPKGLSPCSTV